MEAPPSGRRPSLRARVLLALASLVVTAALLEGLSRLLLLLLPAPPQAVFTLKDVWKHEASSFHQPDARLFWKMVPGYAAGPLRVNAQGFRGPEIAPVRPPGSRRLLLVGDSVTFGFKVPEEQTFAGLLAATGGTASTGDAGGTLVVNAGVIGYTSWQGLRLLEDLAPVLEPDVVGILFGYNDHHTAQRSDAEKAEPEVSGPAPWQKVAVFRLAQRWSGSSGLREQPVARVDVPRFLENARAMQELLQARGARCFFMTVPLRPGVPLVENFTPIAREDGTVEWIRQLDFALEQFRGKTRKAVKDHFLESAPLDPVLADPALEQQLADLCEAHPELPVFWYLRGCLLRHHGRDEEAEGAFEESRRRDGERRQMEAYNEALRELSQESSVELLDLAAKFRATANEGAALFLDVVHPNARGHAVIAAAIREFLAGE